MVHNNTGGGVEESKDSGPPNAATPAYATIPRRWYGVLKTPRFTDDASETDSITIDFSSTTAKLQKIVEE